MSIRLFHEIILFSLAPISVALQIQIPDEKHLLGENTTVILIHEDGDPTDIFLQRIAQNNCTNDIILHVTNFTADQEFNLIFSLSGKHNILAYEMNPTSNHAIAESPDFEVQDDHYQLSHQGQKGGGSNKGLIIGVVLGSTAFTTIILLAVYLIFFCSRRCQSDHEGWIRNSLT
ncbi:hypothetical protein IW261DRAFT_1611343 [Armillaria novae-zelandiae]|uniref:Mid2 domain-containing protein n=1 Tax=Armillaria novae-zelandiae TaxID=153914 RepID=A0AA39NW14_9AGAR|nr:hypothetical protein IW261DRAFT_1611343 [Armillaria novae-zelandiae]